MIQLISERKLSEQDFIEFEIELIKDPKQGKEWKMSEIFELLKEGLDGVIQHQKGKKKN